MFATTNATTPTPEVYKYAVKAFMFSSFTENVNDGKILDALRLMLNDNDYKYFDTKSRKDFVKFCKYQDLHDESHDDVEVNSCIELLLETCKDSSDKFKSLLSTEDGCYYAIKYRSLNLIDSDIVYSFMNLQDNGQLDKKDVMYFVEKLISLDCWPQNKPSLPIDISVLNMIIHASEYSEDEKLTALKYFMYTTNKIDITIFNSTILGSNKHQDEAIGFLETFIFNKINLNNLQTLAEIFTRNYSTKCLEYLIHKGYSGLTHIIRTYIDNINHHDDYTPKLIKLVLSNKPRKPSPNILKLALEAKYDLMRYRDFYKNLNLSHEQIIESKIEDVDAIINYGNK